jgi:hypothetical protein
MRRLTGKSEIAESVIVPSEMMPGAQSVAFNTQAGAGSRIAATQSFSRGGTLNKDGHPTIPPCRHRCLRKSREKNVLLRALLASPDLAPLVVEVS